MRESAKLLTTRADAAKAALSAAMSARDANIAREILERSLYDLGFLTDAVEAVNQRLAAQSAERAALTAHLTGLQGQVEELMKIVKKIAKNQEEARTPKRG
jgi:hypothetical protein